MSLFEPFGVIGWRSVQYPLVAAIVAEVQPLLIGDHGAYKTDGAVDISRLLLGPEARIRKYDTNNLGKDELLGFPDPASLRDRDEDGNLKLKFAYHDLCVWLQDAIILDEINMTNMGVTSSLHELVREGTVMGRETPVRLRWGTLNPPSHYGTRHMNHAFASRFASIEVPSIYNMTKEERLELIQSGGLRWDYRSKYAKKLRNAILLAIMIMRSNSFTKKDVYATAVTVDKILQQAGPLVKSADKFSPVKLSGRQCKNMIKMFLAIEAFKAAATKVGLDLGDMFVDPSTGKNSAHYDTGLKLIAKSCMPEAFGIVKRTTSWQIIDQRISTIVAAFRLDAPMAINRDISYTAKQAITDPAEYARVVSEGIKTTAGRDTLINTMAALEENPGVQLDLSEDAATSLKMEIINRLIDIDFPADEIVGPGRLGKSLRELRDSEYKEPEVLEATDLVSGIDSDWKDELDNVFKIGRVA